MRRRWAIFWNLTWFERRLLLGALVVLPATKIALALFGFRTCHRVLAAWSATDARSAGQPSPEAVVRAAPRMVAIAASRGFASPNCLPQSMALWFLVRRAGIDAELAIGTRKQGEEMDAHAWVEWNGRVLNDRADIHDRFMAFDVAALRRVLE